MTFVERSILDSILNGQRSNPIKVIPMKRTNAYVGLDVHKDSIAVAVADSERDSEVRFYGTIQNEIQALTSLMKRLSKAHKIIEVAYEAGPTGYCVYRHLAKLKYKCLVVAPSSVPKAPHNRIKNDHRDAKSLARLLRAGELSSIWVPDEVHESIRDLLRSRHGCTDDLRKSKTRIKSFLLKYQRSYSGKSWTKKHRTWLANLKFETKAQQITLQNHLNAIDQIQARRDEIDAQLQEIIPEWELSPQVINLQAFRGIGFLIAVTVVAEIGDFSRFSHPSNLMAFIGLIPGEHSSGPTVRSRGITKTGNVNVRKMLFEAAWNYSKRPKVGEWMLKHIPEGITQDIKDIAWKAQLRLHKRFWALSHKGKKSQVAITAVARELVGFIWDVGFHTKPATA
jgi:transposase